MNPQGYETKETLIKISNISLNYDGYQILRDVDAEIKNIVGHGQVVGLLGRSGVGKTSLLRILAGLEKPATGAVTIYDTNENREVAVKSGLVGVVYQSYPLIDRRTVISNLIFAAKRKGRNNKEAREKSIGLLERFNLADRADMYPKQLSGGQRQRVAIIQQLLCSEHYILLDEPFSGLDPIAKAEMCELIQEVANLDERNTIIVVTHDINEAVSVADTIWLMGKHRDDKGQPVPGARIMEVINLVADGMAWHKDIALTSEFAEYVRKLKLKFWQL